MATLKDVAAKAGVTVTTVSRMLNNRGYISQQTREKVLAAMKELDYHPNELARSLTKRHTNIIGIIVPIRFSARRSMNWKWRLPPAAIKRCCAIRSIRRTRKWNISTCCALTK